MGAILMKGMINFNRCDSNLLRLIFSVRNFSGSLSIIKFLLISLHGGILFFWMLFLQDLQTQYFPSIDNVSLLIVNSLICFEVNILSLTTTILSLGLYLHSEVQICVSDALSISSCFQSLLGCLRLSCSYFFFLLSLLSVSFSLSAKRFSLTSLTFFALNSVDSLNLLRFVFLSLVCLISFSFSLSAKRFSCSYFFCLLSLLSVSFSLSAARFCLLHSFTCSFLCSPVLGLLCKNGNFFWMPSIKFLGNFLIWLLKDFNFFFSSSVLNFGLLSSISFFL